MVDYKEIRLNRGTHNVDGHASKSLTGQFLKRTTKATDKSSSHSSPGYKSSGKPKIGTKTGSSKIVSKRGTSFNNPYTRIR